MPARDQMPAARDTSLLPTQEADLTALAITDDANHAVDLSALGFTPLILLIRATGNFLEGSNACVQANDFWRDGGMVHSVAVSGALTWNFMRAAGAGNITIYAKLLGAS